MRDRCRTAKSILDIGAAHNAVFTGWDNVTHVDINEYDYPNFVQMDAHDLKFPDKRFEVAVLGEILEHVKDPEKVLKVALRVASRVIITVPLPEEWDERLRPYDTLEKIQARLGLGPREIARRDNPSVRRFHGDSTGDYSYLYHRRWYTVETFMDLMNKVKARDAHVIKLRHGGWSWLCAELPRRRFKIALISTPYIPTPPQGYGGVERVVADLASGLSELGQDVTIFGASGSRSTGDYETVECIDPPENFGSDWKSFDWYEAEKKMWASCRSDLRDFDIVHGHGIFCFEALLGRHVFHTHHSGISWSTAPPKTTLIMPSISMQAYARGLFDQIPVELCYNGIDLDSYPLKTEKGDRLMFLGRFISFKQSHVAIEVADKLGLGLDLVGGPHDQEYYERLLSLAEGKDVRFHINVDHETKVELLQNAKCLLVPSASGEPFGLVAVEALACGTPVVALRDGALPEIVTPKVGAVCDSKDEMVKAVKELKVKPLDCRKRAALFSKELMALRCLEIYRSV